MDIKGALQIAMTGTTQKDESSMQNTDLIPLYNASNELAGKITRADLMDAVKNSLGSLLNGGTAQTSITKVPSLNGNTLGATTMFNLASVLGNTRTNISSNTDLNNLTTIGRYACASGSVTQTLSNCPISTAFTLDVIPTPSEVFYSQIIYAATSPGPQIWIRRKNQTGWEAWIRIGSYITGLMPNNTDVKELPEGRYLKNTSVTGATGYPSQVTGSFIVEVVYDSIDNTSNHIWLYDIQNPGSVYFNVKWNGTWGGWQRIDNYGTSTAAELATLLGGTQSVKMRSAHSLANQNRYIEITAPGSYYPISFFLSGMLGNYYAVGNSNVGNNRISGVSVKNIIGTATAKVYFLNSKLVIDSYVSNQQLNVVVFTDSSNVSISTLNSYDTTGMTEVTIS